MIVTDESSESMPKVRADYTRVKQILLNLLSNAVKYNDPGGCVSIRVDETVPGFLRFVVEDNGIGIDEEKQKDMFTPFARMVETPDDVEGTGIGMTISRQLVEKMGGDIGFESQLGVGSTFWFTLPVSVSAQEEPVAEQGIVIEESDAVEETSALALKSVLYVEDNQTNISFMQTVFDDLQDYELTIALTGEEGIEKALADKPDLVLLDLALPGKDGFQVFRAIKGNPDTEFVPVIAVSADAMEKTVNRVKKQGFNGYLSKPVDIDLLQTTMNELLEVV